jgi:hypothetical protein
MAGHDYPSMLSGIGASRMSASCPDLIRTSIFSKGWIAGSSPAMTPVECGYVNEER